ncbi:MBL fold metallo-hydrolase [Taurinivorans muris]|uniref:MBL fold metallo-hydrolase n=1 Tax=Taurinivorans muris TaxID=2787751 RepID=A0ABY5Y1L8_9BACT|nr:MBL fold metallo-hydrolase [Desulfovibrionaceae bacterium LT0009]
MPVLTFSLGPLETNCHLYQNGTDALIIDPSGHMVDILTEIKNKKLKIQGILLTHLHFDHVYGCAELESFMDTPIMAGKEDIEISDVLISSAVRYGLPKVDEFHPVPLAEGIHKFGSIEVDVRHVPGHSPGSLAYYIKDENIVFTGDVLFYRSIGRSDLPMGDFELLAKSIREKLYTLPENTVVYCGHGPETTIGDERIKNSFVRI